MLLYSQDSTPAFELGKLYQNQEMLPLRNSAAVIQTPDTKSCFSKEWHGMISRVTFPIATAPRFQSHCRMMAAAHHSAARIGHRRWLWAVQENSEYRQPSKTCKSSPWTAQNHLLPQGTAGPNLAAQMASACPKTDPKLRMLILQVGLVIGHTQDM